MQREEDPTRKERKGNSYGKRKNKGIKTEDLKENSREERTTSVLQEVAEYQKKISNVLVSIPNLSPEPNTSSIGFTKPSNNPNIISLKLLVDTEKRRVMFAEANKEFVDFLFSLISLPLGNIISLILSNSNDNIMVGSFGKLYKSFENLSDLYIQPDLNKQTLLKPNTTVNDVETLLFLPNINTKYLEHKTSTVYSCSTANCKKYVTYNPKDVCLSCGKAMSSAMPFIPVVHHQSSDHDQRGYVKEFFTYVIMDDLEVKPMSDLSNIIALLNKLNIKDQIGVFEQKAVSLRKAEGLKLLKASLESKTVLTDVFLTKGKQAAA